jgi:nucleoside-diphosphate-sugar epimerase
VRELLSSIERVIGRRVVIERAEGEYAGVRRNLLDVSKLHVRTGWSPCVDLDAGIAHLWRTIAQ